MHSLKVTEHGIVSVGELGAVAGIAARSVLDVFREHEALCCGDVADQVTEGECSRLVAPLQLLGRNAADHSLCPCADAFEVGEERLDRVNFHGGIESCGLLVVDDGFSFDLHQHLRSDQPGHLHHAGDRADLTKEFPVSPANFLPLRDVDDVHPGADYVVQISTQALQGSLDVAERLYGLPVGIANAHDFAGGAGGGGAGHVHVRANPHRAGIPDDGLPSGSGGERVSLHRKSGKG